MPTPNPLTRLPAANRPVKILAVLPVLGQPRHAKRLDTLKSMGFDLEVAAFQREYHNGRRPDCEVNIIGKAVQGSYLPRLLALIKAIPKIRSALARADVVYAFGPDMAMLAVLARLTLGTRVPVFIEIGDVVPLQVSSGLRGLVYRTIDRWLMNHCTCLVTTTPKFLSEYYRAWLRVSIDGLVLENKVETTFGESVRCQDLQTRRSRSPQYPIRIGYFGLLGCQWALDVFRGLADEYPGKFEFVLAGYRWTTADVDGFLQRTRGCATYLGEYKSPTDLSNLYTSVDVVWACYPPIGPSDWNLRWARPNRFYESCLFQTPLVTRDGSCDAVDVSRLGIGAIVDKVEVGEAVIQLASMLTPNAILGWSAAMEDVPISVYQYTNEFDILACKLREAALID
jgi:succinoglycan biosynthesis protein ExoL